MTERITETCSCGASIEFTRLSHSSTQEMLTNWRREHQHPEPARLPDIYRRSEQVHPGLKAFV